VSSSRRDPLVLGIDPGSQKTGWGLIEIRGSELRPVEYGVINLPQKAPLSERLPVLHEEICSVLKKCDPSEVAIEELYVARNARSALVLGHARGVIVLACAQSGLIPHEYPANTVKQAVLGQGGASATKERVAFMVKAILGLAEIPKPDDITDALACAICHAHKRDLPK
jgi:crossover junction endodeoxyribonuclease RuvC